jgi:LemA protein
MVFFFVTLAGLLFLTVIVAITIYNRFVRLRNLATEAWSGIDIQLKRRHDLIPNLLETVRAYAGHERSLFENVSKIRVSAAGAGNIAEKAGAENALSGQLRKLLAVAEAYPQLKASENYLELQKSLSAVEDELQLARRYYNGTVRDWNTSLQAFPSNIIGQTLKYQPLVYFEIETSAREIPSAAA